jgi:hypothetical protein
MPLAVSAARCYCSMMLKGNGRGRQRFAVREGKATANRRSKRAVPAGKAPGSLNDVASPSCARCDVASTMAGAVAATAGIVSANRLAELARLSSSTSSAIKFRGGAVDAGVERAHLSQTRAARCCAGCGDFSGRLRARLSSNDASGRVSARSGKPFRGKRAREEGHVTGLSLSGLAPVASFPSQDSGGIA